MTMPKFTGATLPKIRTTGPTLSPVDTSVIADALGTDTTSVVSPKPQGPLALFAPRKRLMARPQSTGASRSR